MDDRSQPYFRAWLVSVMGFFCGSVPSLVHATISTIQGTDTGIVSTTSYTISHRDQRHSWQTSDGAMHIFANVGTTPTNQSLVLYSTFDGGVTWTPMLTLPNSDGDSTVDGIMGSGGSGQPMLQLVYQTVQGSSIVYATATYSASTQSWTLASIQTAFTPTGALSTEPGFAVDTAGNLWCGFTLQNIATLAIQIQMIYLPVNTSTWVTSSLTFPGSGSTLQHAARPVTLSDRVGMIYQVNQTLFWSYRLNSWPVGHPWNSAIITTALPNRQSYADDTAFSVVGDAADNLYVGFTGKTTVEYTTYNGHTGLWSPAMGLTKSNTTSAYVKTTIAGSTIYMIINTSGSLAVYSSTDGGASYQLIEGLAHPQPPPAGVSYGNPRIESPATSTGTLPVWQQYTNGANQGLLYFPVPIAGP